MRLNWVSIFAGLGAGIGLTALGWWVYETKIGPKSEHDEPVIIENGSTIVDFNPWDNKNIVGSLIDHMNAQTYHRSGADPVKLVRVFQKKEGKYSLLECIEKDCHTPDSKKSSLEVTLSNGHKLYFHWEAKKKSGLVMYSAFPRFVSYPEGGKKNPHRFRSEDGAGSPVKIVGVAFTTINEKPQNFPFSPADDVKIQLCTWDDYDHCKKYNP